MNITVENTYPSWYVEQREKIISNTREKRRAYKQILSKHLKQAYGHFLLTKEDLSKIDSILFLLSSSRSGSSVTADILRQQARSTTGTGKQIICLPGEHRPLFELAGLSTPFNMLLVSDELGSTQAKSENVDILLDELSAEIGYPLESTFNLLEFAITIYGRLLLQWPKINFGSPEEAIGNIYTAVRTCGVGDPLEYKDSPESRHRLMHALQRVYPKIDLRLYDGVNSKGIVQPKFESNHYDNFLEEPPFIVPSPWCFPSKTTLRETILMLKDPSDAWRIPFWMKALHGQTIHWMHLTRNAPESINGLCDGWRYPYGYITKRFPRPLKINGYTSTKQPWTQWYVNYSTSDKVWQLLLNKETIDLELVAATQWEDAHKSILNSAGNDPNYYRIISEYNSKSFGFEWIRSEPVQAVTAICKKFAIELSPSLVKAARQIGARKVQVTPGTNANPMRWKHSCNHEKIMEYVKSDSVAEVSMALGYD